MGILLVLPGLILCWRETESILFLSAVLSQLDLLCNICLGVDTNVASTSILLTQVRAFRMFLQVELISGKVGNVTPKSELGGRSAARQIYHTKFTQLPEMDTFHGEAGA